ncbi:hypothetical protein [Pseudomonas sp. MF6747]|uniref:hypothetical protein n=1 Tax=Pseudomonas sp. MF6747 TaxID=2797527 RepID=UPI0019092ED2|nr:hypothetical protein [Pseudomonas sp. MF6747]MBK3505919.1 hypothetical protein [Pseudomonas sp. MF6747]
MSNIDYFMAGLSRAVVRVNERRDKKAQHTQKIESKGEFSGDAAFSKTKIKPSVFKLTDEQYKTIITSKMISHIKKKGAMNDYSYHGRPSPI